MSQESKCNTTEDSRLLKAKLTDLKFKTRQEYDEDSNQRQPLYPHNTLKTKQLQEVIRLKIGELMAKERQNSFVQVQIEGLKEQKQEVESICKKSKSQFYALKQRLAENMRRLYTVYQRAEDLQRFSDLLRSYPTVAYDPNSNPSLLNLCTMCESLIEPAVQVRITGCQHVFHAFCFQQMLILGRCRACRTPLSGIASRAVEDGLSEIELSQMTSTVQWSEQESSVDISNLFVPFVCFKGNDEIDESWEQQKEGSEESKQMEESQEIEQQEGLSEGVCLMNPQVKQGQNEKPMNDAENSEDEAKPNLAEERD